MTNRLPPGWTLTTLEKVASWGSGGTPKRSEHRYYGGNIPWAVIGDLNDGKITSCSESITQEGLDNSSCKLVEPGTVLIAMYGSIGKLGIADMHMATNQAIAHAGPHIDRSYLFYYLLSQRHALAGAGKGATQRNISQTVLRAWPIPVAPPAEQRRIVAAIEEHFTRLDAVEATLQMGLQRLAMLKSVVLVEAFHSNRGLPSHWNRATLGDIAEVRGGIQKQPKRRPNEYPAPFLRVANVLRGELRLDEVHQIELFDGELEKYRLHIGDLLVVEGNGSPHQIGRAACWEGEIADCVHQNHLIRVRPGPTLVPRYLALYWNAPHTASVLRDVASSTSGLYTLSTAKVKSIPIPLAPLSEQQRIAEEVHQHLEASSRLERSIQRTLSRLQAVRRSVLAMAFSGQLVLQDPDDEPASALLERMQRLGRPC